MQKHGGIVDGTTIAIIAGIVGAVGSSLGFLLAWLIGRKQITESRRQVDEAKAQNLSQQIDVAVRAVMGDRMMDFNSLFSKEGML